MSDKPTQVGPWANGVNEQQPGEAAPEKGLRALIKLWRNRAVEAGALGAGPDIAICAKELEAALSSEAGGEPQQDKETNR
jgi:hypothetical protein